MFFVLSPLFGGLRPKLLISDHMRTLHGLAVSDTEHIRTTQVVLDGRGMAGESLLHMLCLQYNADRYERYPTIEK